MIGIEAVAGFVPPGRIDNVGRSAALGVDEAFLRDKIGFLQVARKAVDQDTSDLCVAAFEALRQRAPIEPGEIDCCIVCTQNPDGFGLPQTSAIVHRKLDLPESCAAFDVSLGCSGWVYGLAIASSFMAANGRKRGVLFTADPYSTILDEGDRSTALLFGDGAAATLLTDRPVWTINGAKFGSWGSDADAIRVGPDRKLQMNGRSVFAFAATRIPELIQGLLAEKCLKTDDIDRFLVHQGSRFIVDTIRRNLAVEADKVPFRAGLIGNTVSSTLPLMLASGEFDGYRRLLATGFGVGLSWAAAILERQHDELPHG